MRAERDAVELHHCGSGGGGGGSTTEVSVSQYTPRGLPGSGGAESPAAAGSGGATAAVVLRHMRKEFGSKVAVRDLCLRIEDGECFGLLGVNGAGKSTTFGMLTGALAPTSGDALLHGMSILDEQASIRKLVGYCPQHDALQELMTGREHLRLYGRLKGVPAALLEDEVTRLIVELDLGAHADKQAGRYSGGNKKKLCVGLALIGGPQARRAPSAPLLSPTSALRPLNPSAPPPPPTARAARRALIGDGRRVEAFPVGRDPPPHRRLLHHPHHPLDGGTRRPPPLPHHPLPAPHPASPASTPQPLTAPPPSPLSGVRGPLLAPRHHGRRRAHLPRPHPGARPPPPRPRRLTPSTRIPPTPPPPAHQALKSQYGQGYKVDLRLDGAAAGTATAATAAAALAFVQRRFAGAALEEDEPPTAAITVPREDADLPRLFDHLAKARDELGASEVSVTQCTLEQIFLQMASKRELRNDNA